MGRRVGGGSARDHSIGLSSTRQYFGPARKYNIYGRQKAQLELFGQSVEVLGENLSGLAFGLKPLVGSHVNCNGLQLCGQKDFAKDVGRAILGRRLALLGPVGQCAFAHSVHLLERSREVWDAWRALFLPSQEGAGGLERAVVALIGLHFLAAEGEARSSGSQSPYVEAWP